MRLLRAEEGMYRKNNKPRERALEPNTVYPYPTSACSDLRAGKG